MAELMTIKEIASKYELNPKKVQILITAGKVKPEGKTKGKNHVNLYPEEKALRKIIEQLDYEKRIYKTEAEKIQARIDEIKLIYEYGEGGAT